MNPPWSADEVEKLKTLRAAGMTQPGMAQRLGRTVPAVRAQVRRLKLPHLHKVPPRPAREAHSVAAAPRAGKVTLPPLASLRDC